MKRRNGKTGAIMRVWRYVDNYRAAFVLSLACSAVFVGASLYLPILFGRAADMITGKDSVDFSGLFGIFVKAAVFAAIAGVSQWAAESLCIRIADGVTRRIRNDAFSRLSRVPLSEIDRRPVGDILSVEIGDADRLSDGLLLGFSRFFTGILTIVGTLVCMIIINPVIAAAVAVLTPVSLFTAKFIAGRTYKHFGRQAEITGEQSAIIDETLGNLAAVKAYNAESRFSSDFGEINERLKDSSFKAIFFSSLTNPTTRFINACVYAAVAFFGALLAVNGAAGALAVTAGSLLALLSYANKYTKPFNEISEVMAELSGAKACAERLFKIIDAKEETDAEGAEEFVPSKGDVRIEGVGFSYDKSRPLIKGFDLDVKSGQKIAIVGPTGCGKTTFINLLMRFYDVDEGKITVDGKDIKGVKRKALRACYGMVLQDAWIRKASVKDNIKIGKKDASDSEVEEAARLARADGFIKRLPFGYDTVISEDGLSEGQKQLLSIARVMLCLPPMIILDEATSSIDTRTEIKIQQAFDGLTEGKTSFIVAHRLSTIVSADVILVMNAGNVIEQGTHSELMEKKGFYYDLYNSQFKN